MVGRRKRTFRPRGRPLARVRRSWVTNIRASWCNPYQFQLQACSEGRSATSLIFQIVNQTILQDEFSDSAAVKRVVGDLFFQPFYDNPPPALTDVIAAEYALTAYQAFAGLRKRQVNAAGETIAVHPLDDDEDYGDARWLRTWHHLNYPGSYVEAGIGTTSGQYPVIRPDVHTYVVPGTPACNTLATGSGTICIETENTLDCEACDSSHTSSILAITQARPWHFHMDIKRKRGMYLKENEELVLQVDLAFPFLTPWMANEPSMQAFGGIKALLQY